jgi:hypothetical protein
VHANARHGRAGTPLNNPSEFPINYFEGFAFLFIAIKLAEFISVCCLHSAGFIDGF